MAFSHHKGQMPGRLLVCVAERLSSSNLAPGEQTLFTPN